jgi:hypothetical protein
MLARMSRLPYWLTPNNRALVRLAVRDPDRAAQSLKFDIDPSKTVEYVKFDFEEVAGYDVALQGYVTTDVSAAITRFVSIRIQQRSDRLRFTLLLSDFRSYWHFYPSKCVFRPILAHALLRKGC